MANTSKYKAVLIALKSGSIKVYASPRIRHALKELREEMSLYKGVRFLQVLQAVYLQGKKDGARVAFEALDESLSKARRAVPHRNPGRPRNGKS